MEYLSGNLVKSLLVLAVTYIFWKIQRFIINYRHWWKMASKMSPLGTFHPIWGSLHQFDSLAGFMKLQQKIVDKERPKILSYWFTSLSPHFNVCHPDTAKVLLKSSAPKSINIGGGYYYLMEWLGDGLLNSSGKKWHRNRRLLTPGFYLDILKPYIHVYNSTSDSFLENLEKHTRNGQSVDIFPLVALETLDAVLKCTFSFQGSVQTEGEKHPYVAAVGRLSSQVETRWRKPWLQWNFVYHLTKDGREHSSLCKYVHEFSQTVIDQRRQIIEKEGPPTKRHLDFLDILLTARDENGTGLTNLEIRDEVDTFLFEGHDTTASAISWAIYHLGRYQDEQEKVYREISELLGHKQQISWENLQEMPTLTAFVRESMRMVAPVPAVSRLLIEPLTFGDVTIPAGMDVDLSIQMIHHHPDVWPEHETFKLDRFMQSSIIERHPYSFLPFSAGSRNCIGQHLAMDEIKVVVGKLVQRYKVSLLPDHVYEMSPELIMRAKYGIEVTLERR